MNINNTMKLVFFIIGAGIVVSFFTIIQLNGLMNKVDEMAQIRYESYQTADELRQSSDDLTRLGRTYTVTGNEKYEKMYNDILAIRNGEKARPKDYHTIYWDLVLEHGEKPKPDGQAISLNQRMRDLGFTEKEFDLLKKAQANSDGLVNMEVKAMNAVKGLYPDSSGNYTVRGEPDKQMAIELLHSSQYHQEKAKIMKPIESFFIALEQRTDAQFHEAAASVKKTVLIGNISLAVVIVIAILGYIITKRTVVNPIDRMASTLKKVDDNSDLTLRVDDSKKNEIGTIGSTVNKVIESYSSTIEKINDVNHMIAQITDKLVEITSKNAKISNQQNQELEMGATAMEEMTSALATVAENTSMAEKYAGSTEKETSTSKEVFDKTMAEFGSLETEFTKTSEVIQELADESTNVGNVLDVIKGIAEQTNLLALNAAIEAARAGDQGRGFAVVADEVRSLAQRTQKSAGEIEEMIGGLQSKAEQSTQTIRVNADKIASTRDNMTTANEALGTIKESAVEIHRLNSSIASATEEQLSVSDEISSNLSNIKTLSSDMHDAIDQLGPIVSDLKDNVDSLNGAIQDLRT